MAGSWDDMLRANELRRRRELARLTKPALISLVVELEQQRDTLDRIRHGRAV